MKDSQVHHCVLSDTSLEKILKSELFTVYLKKLLKLKQLNN